ncbi:peptidoglycan-binding protein [Roseomonas sp. KE2513]|uniref:peptidoglycan-binding domain-containing protein n=1 Tax=Roseomonas sp. KE2513 TaxID=2479202 RepID=UPI0018DFEBF2|nr:peptidoglycan-binding protein [Roseomonas sp. KE2513]MBI0536234.1 peptidoglycan-binding protein [Roseomonas sp. KE2513]
MERLDAFAREGKEPLTSALLIKDNTLVSELQARLSAAGLLDPPEDGFLGPATQWALMEFCRLSGLDYEGALSPDAARALLAAPEVLPLHPGPDLAGRIAAALLRRGDWICRHPDCTNIIYVEGLDTQGRRTPRRPDHFDDLRLLLRVAPGGRPEIAGAWTATTAPGRPAVEEPAEPAGAPRLRHGQHRAWVVGRTAIGTPQEQEALVQLTPLPVTRDANRDFHRADDPEGEELLIIDQHGGLGAPQDEVGGAGAGCLVGREQDGHRAFMAALRADPRWIVNNAHVFTTSVLGADEVLG